MNDINNPHDRFFRKIFSRKDVAIDFLRNYLPSDVIATMDVTSIKIQKDSFIDKELGEHRSDLLYEVNLNDNAQAWVYLLFEHKSQPDPMVAFQLLRYMVRIWEHTLKQHQPLRQIFPIVFYHGQISWHISEHFRDMFRITPALEPYLPQFRYCLCDLSRYSNDELKGMALLQVALFVMKYIFSNDIQQHYSRLLSMLMELLRQETGLDYLETIFRYLIAASEKVSGDDLKENILKHIPKGEHVMATIAQQYINQGIEIGTLNEALNGIELGLELKFGNTGLRELETIKTIDNITVLRQIRSAIKTVQSLDELRTYYSEFILKHKSND